MTYRRPPMSWAGAITRIVELCGVAPAAMATGVGASRLRQLANPMRVDCRVLDIAFDLDLLAATNGCGVPLFETYRRKLIAAGALKPDQAERRYARLVRAVRAATRALLMALPVEEPAAEDGIAA